LRVSLRPLRHALLSLFLVCFSPPLISAKAETIALTIVHGGQETALTLDQLGEMPRSTIVTDTEFTDGLVEYKGPLVRDLLEKLGLGEAELLRFTAANDYFVEIPTSDFHDYDVILAMEADGVALTRRTRGPLWLMYPIADFPELRDRIYNNRLIWQVVTIESL
jgi:hypothetical protein